MCEKGVYFGQLLCYISRRKTYRLYLRVLINRAARFAPGVLAASIPAAAKREAVTRQFVRVRGVVGGAPSGLSQTLSVVGLSPERSRLGRREFQL